MFAGFAISIRRARRDVHADLSPSRQQGTFFESLRVAGAPADRAGIASPPVECVHASHTVATVPRPAAAPMFEIDGHFSVT